MVKKILFLVFALIICAHSVHAESTEIKVKTVPYYEVQVTAFEADSEAFETLERFKGEADKYGEITFDFDSEEDFFRLITFIKWNGETVLSEKLEDEFEAGEPVYLEMLPPGFEPVEKPAPKNETNQTVTEEIAVEENLAEEVLEENSESTTENAENAEITGLSVAESQSSGNWKMILFYASTAIVAVALLITVFRKRDHKAKLHGLDYKPEKNIESAQMITEIESKISDAQKEVGFLKNQQKLKEAEDRLKKDQQDLENLRKGSNDKFY